MNIEIAFEENYLRYRASCDDDIGYGETRLDAVDDLILNIRYRKKYQKEKEESMNINELRDAVKSQIARYEAVLQLTETATPPAAIHTLIEDCCERGLELTIDFCGVDNEYDYDKLPDFGEGDITLSESSSKS